MHIFRVVFAALLAVPAFATSVAVVSPPGLRGPAAHGVSELTASLSRAGFTVERVTPQTADFVIVAAVRVGMPGGREALEIRRGKVGGKPALLLTGSDDRGLMYAALDTADRIAWTPGAKDPFSNVRDVAEKPYLPERGISMYTMQRAWFESRLYDENHWKRYFDLLARSRINTFTVIFGYENGGFMAPLYPYFFDVAGFPGVKLTGITKAQQERNTAAFQAVIGIAHERGIDVIAGVWDHIYRGGVQAGGIAGASENAGKEIPGLVTGLDAANVGPYTQSALRRLMEVFPGIDGLEFRMHNESGLKREEMPAFWHQVFGMLAAAKPGMRVTLRAKELPDSIIDDALAQGLNARIETKYWMEQMGMPFHPTHINRQDQSDRRHGYADLLKYPQRYRLLWRLWTGGTTRLLLWGDPDYVRRFAASARLYDGNAIDANEMLATKMLGEPHEKAPLPILAAPNRYYEYEFERYWHFYQVWGRVSYNPDTPADTWEREFDRRFGQAGRNLMEGLHTASRILPRIVAASYRYQLFPTTRGWAEMMREGDLPDYAKLEGSDIEQFQGPKDAARDIAAGTPTSLRRPSETSRWFESMSADVLKDVAAARAAGATGKEARSTIADLEILAGLARFHAARLTAAVDFNLGDYENMLAHERKAIDAWAALTAAAGDIYSDDLPFGVHRVGFPRHWKEELANLQEGLKKLETQKPAASPAKRVIGDLPSTALRAQLDPPGIAQPGKDLTITVRTSGPVAVKSLRLRYRHLTQVEDYQAAEMSCDARSGVWTAAIPAAFIDPKWDLVYFVEAIDANGSGRNFPDLEVTAPYVVVPVRRP
jgi:hypothetical protein